MATKGARRSRKKLQTLPVRKLSAKKSKGVKGGGGSGTITSGYDFKPTKSF